MALGIGVAIGMLGLGGYALVEARNDTWSLARQNANNLLHALDRDIGRNIALLDLSLVGVMEALAEPEISAASPRVRHHAMFDRSASAEDLGSILVLDESGEVVEDSTSIEPHRQNLAEKDYFRVHRDSPNAGLFVSRPFRNPVAAGDFSFAISRRVSGPDGAFRGVVNGTLRLSYFRHLFEKLDLGQHGSIGLFRSDGRIMMRYPFAERDVDRDLSHSSMFQRVFDGGAGQYVANAAIDGLERLYTFRRIGELPLILTVNLSTADILAPWQRKAMVIGPVLLLLSAAAVASSLLFRREVLRRVTTERALESAAAKLAVMASTDGLTGLNNRRAFEAEIDRAFRRAIRSGHTLTVLMLDADFFKRYNDRYGHLAGDDVLRAIAGCLDRNMRRPDDIAARYGGEEFVALLPDTDMQAGLTIADRIRAAIENLAVDHVDSPLGRVTVSVGVASATPFIGDNLAALVQAADQALYAAKRDGRNTVRMLAVARPTDARLLPATMAGAMR